MQLSTHRVERLNEGDVPGDVQRGRGHERARARTNRKSVDARSAPLNVWAQRLGRDRGRAERVVNVVMYTVTVEVRQ